MSITITAIITLSVGFLGATSLFWLKRLELKRGHMYFSSFRRRADGLVLNGVRVIRHHLPGESKKLSKKVVLYTVIYASATLLRGVRLIERRLVGFLNMIKGRGEVKTNGTASMFLRNVSEHKNKIHQSNTGESSKKSLT